MFDYVVLFLAKAYILSVSNWMIFLDFQKKLLDQERGLLNFLHLHCPTPKKITNGSIVAQRATTQIPAKDHCLHNPLTSLGLQLFVILLYYETIVENVLSLPFSCDMLFPI